MPAQIVLKEEKLPNLPCSCLEILC